MYLFNPSTFAIIQKNALLKALKPSNIIRKYLHKIIVFNSVILPELSEHLVQTSIDHFT